MTYQGRRAGQEGGELSPPQLGTEAWQQALGPSALADDEGSYADPCGQAFRLCVVCQLEEEMKEIRRRKMP